MNRPPIPAEHRPILAKVAKLMLEHLLANEAQKSAKKESPDLPVTTTGTPDTPPTHR